MKNTLILTAVVAIVIAAAAYIAIIAFVPSSDSASVFENAMNKVANISEYEIVYAIDNSIQIGEESIKLVGTMHVTHSTTGDKLYVKLESPSGTEDVENEIYSLPSGVYSCDSSFGVAICQRYNETSQISDPVSQAKSVLKLAELGFVDMQLQTSRMILKRDSDTIKFTYNIAKMVANASLPEGIAAGIKEMAVIISFDKQTGLPLEYETTVRLEAEKSMTSTVKMTATSLELTASDVKLPANATIY